MNNIHICFLLVEVSTISIVDSCNAIWRNIYNAAFAFLYPSLRESFGIPMLEAMACGTPIITGNTSSMPEVAGPGALTIDPYKPEEIANALLCLETDNVLYQQQQNYGLERVKQFSWKQTANQLTSIYQNALL